MTPSLFHPDGAIPPALDPATLKAARLARGLSLAGLASLTGISAPTLSRLEVGKRAASSEHAQIIADALHFPVTALSRPLVSARLGLSSFYHRKLSRAPAGHVQQIENRCVLDAVVIRELIGMVGTQQPECVPALSLDDARGDPERAAHMMRLKWGVPRGPIQNLCSLVERAGCIVLHSDFGLPEMDALYQKASGVPPIFWVNSRKPIERVRMSIAHELGHLVLHEEQPTDNERAEREANRFAAAFLMPRPDFRSECPPRLSIPTLVELKRRWRCSMSAIARRACDVERISKRDYTNIMIQLTKEGWRTQEPYPITGESPTAMASIISEAMNACGCDEQELSERLAVSVEQLRTWRQPFPGQRPSVAEPGATASPLRLRFVSGA